MTMEHVSIGGSVIVSTRGFADLPPDLQVVAMKAAINHLSKETDFIVLSPDARGGHYEDQGRTWKQSWLGPKVYAKRDDHGTPEALSEWMGRKVTTQFLLTFMLAEEY